MCFTSFAGCSSCVVRVPRAAQGFVRVVRCVSFGSLLSEDVRQGASFLFLFCSSRWTCFVQCVETCSSHCVGVANVPQKASIVVLVCCLFCSCAMKGCKNNQVSSVIVPHEFKGCLVCGLIVVFMLDYGF